jgi:PAS domain S-box-containing protein
MENPYQSFFAYTAFGSAFYKAIYDTTGHPVDYEFLDVNPAFENLTGLKPADIIGKTVCEVIPGIKDSDFDLTAHYDVIALYGGEKEFEQFFEPLNKWFKVQVFSSQKGYITTIFYDISIQFKLAEASRTFLSYTSETVDYQHIVDVACDIAGATFAALNIFGDDGHQFTTVAIAGPPDDIQRITQQLGVQFRGLSWNYTPEIEEKFYSRKTTILKKISLLTETLISSESVDALAGEMNVDWAVLVKIEQQGRMLGGLTFLFSDQKQLQHQLLIETYADMIGMLLDRLNQERALVRERNTLQQINEQSPASVVITNTEGIIEYVNPTFVQVTGYTFDEVVGQNPRVLKSDEHSSEEYAVLWDTISSGKVWRGEFHNMKKNGELFWELASIAPIYGIGGEIGHYIAVKENITERKALEEDLIRQNNLRNLLMGIASGFINVPLDEVDDSIQKALEELAVFVNADRSYIFDYDWEKRVSNNTYEWCAEGISHEINNLQNVPFEMMGDWVEIHSKGDSIYIPDLFLLPDDDITRQSLEPQGIKSLLAVPMMQQERCIGFVGFDSVKQHHLYSSADQQLLQVFAKVLANVRIRKEMLAKLVLAKQKIEENERKLKESQTIAKLGGWELDLKTEVFTFNDNFYSMFHTNVDEMGGYEMTVKEYAERFLFPEELHFVIEEVEQAIKSTDPNFTRYFEHKIRYYDGGIGYIAVKYYIFKDAAGQTVKTYGVNQDITEKKLLELDLMQAKEKAEESNRLKTAFLNNISHEIRTPLNGILGFADLFMSEGLTYADKVHYYTILQQSTNRLLQTVTDIMDNAELIAKTILPCNEEVHVASLINDQVEKLHARCMQKKIDLLVQVPVNLASLVVHTDEALLAKVFQQLLDNALKFTATGTITIGCVENGSFLRFFIQDTGKGIASDKLVTVFEPFFQEDTSMTRHFEGSGLGLSIAKGIVEILGGGIELESEEGKGTTVYFEIPLNNNTKI